jgi:hypothetical protein
MPSGALPSKDDAIALNIVVQQLGVGHSILPVGTELVKQCVHYGE